MTGEACGTHTSQKCVPGFHGKRVKRLLGSPKHRREDDINWIIQYGGNAETCR
jgi:hypothetical protein